MINNKQEEKQIILEIILRQLSQRNMGDLYALAAENAGSNGSDSDAKDLYEKAIKSYKDNRDPDSLVKAAEIAKHLGMVVDIKWYIERNVLFRRAIKKFEKRGKPDDFLHAARATRKLGQSSDKDKFYRRAIEMYDLKGEFKKCEEIANEAGFYDMAEFLRIKNQFEDLFNSISSK